MKKVGDLMIKNTVCVVFLLLAHAVVADNYTITIDGQSYDIALNKSVEVKVGDELVTVQLEQKDVLKYSVKNFSFDHAKEYLPSKTDLGDGLYQTVLMTPLGSAVMIQEYITLAPSGMMDLMINEITKEERDYGYTIESKAISKTLSDGVSLSGFEVTSKYKDSDIKRMFLTFDVKDSGLFIMTQIDYGIAANDDAFIKVFYDSLKISMK